MLQDLLSRRARLAVQHPNFHWFMSGVGLGMAAALTLFIEARLI